LGGERKHQTTWGLPGKAPLKLDPKRSVATEEGTPRQGTTKVALQEGDIYNSAPLKM